MKGKICISSDIEMSHLTLDYDFLLDIEGLNLSNWADDNPLIHIMDQNLLLAQDYVQMKVEKLLLHTIEPESVISKKLESGKIVEFRRNLTEIEYRGKLFKLDLRDNNDFNLCAYIDLLSMILLCVQLKGILYLFNRELFEKDEGISIIGYLRLNHSKKKEEIGNGLNDLWKKLKISSSIDNETLRMD